MATQTRISPETHEKVARLAAETGRTHQQVIDIAVSNYEREVFLAQVNEGFAALRADPEAWKEEQAEREAWEITLSDSSEP